MRKPEIISLYEKRARNYDLTANLYYLVGYREWAYRKRAVGALSLRAGDAVVEIGCGTGLNFPLLEKAVGPGGRIIGVDMTGAMLERAGGRVSKNNWSNVELVHADALSFEFPPGVNGIISTFALTLIPEYEEVIKRGGEALAPGGRFVVLDLKMPENRLRALAPLLMYLVRPFGATEEVLSRRPWESMAGHFGRSHLTELYCGMSYVAVGEKVRATGQGA